MYYTVSISKSGKPYLVFQGGREIRIHSAYDPVGEAEKSAAAFKPGRSSMIAVSGLGLGYHAFFLKKKFPDKIIAVIEKDPEVVSLAREHCTPFLEGLHIFSGKERIADFFDAIDIASFRGLASFVHRPSYSIDPAFYNSALENIKNMISSRVSDLFTRFEFEEKWMENIFQNLRLLKTAMPVKKFFGHFRGTPGLIISAGPSLRYSLPFLEEFKKKAVTVAVDTSIKVLDKTGFTPHFIMTLDAQSYSLKHFLGIDMKNAVLVADMVSFPAVPEAHRGPVALSTTSKYYRGAGGIERRETTGVMNWLEKHMESTGDIQSGGSVATSAFDFLLSLGCSPIILAGQDLAYTGREIHCSGTYHNDDWIPLTTRLKNLDSINQAVIRKRKIQYLGACGGGRVVSDFVFDLYRKWFEDSASRVNLPVINISTGGASIKNTMEKSPAELLNELRMPDEEPSLVISGILSRPVKTETALLGPSLKNALQKLNHILKTSVPEEMMLKIEEAGLEELVMPYLKRASVMLTKSDPGCGLYGRKAAPEVKQAVEKTIIIIKNSGLAGSV